MDVRFEADGDGRFRVAGRLGFDTVHAIWDSSRAGLAAAAEPTVDLGEVTHVDSAGLALVLEWIGLARRGGRRIRLLRVPRKLQDLARISEVNEFMDEAG